MERRVLVVDDDPVNRELASRQLAAFGCRVDAAENGPEAVDAVRAEAPDLILMDVQMPGMDGLETTRAIRELDSMAGRPIAAMTANATIEDREACFAAGMDDYVSKPVALEDVQGLLARWFPGEALDVSFEAGVPAAGGGTPQPPGPVALERIRVEMEGGDGLARLIDLYLGRLDTRVGAIRSAIETGDAGELRASAHALKGPSTIFGADGLVRICGELERLGRDGGVDGAAELLPVLESEAGRVGASLEAERG